MYTIPLSNERLNKEKEIVLNMAKINGFSTKTIHKMMDKKLKQMEAKKLTTFYESKKKNDFKNTIVLTYHPDVNYKLIKAFKRIGIRTVNRSYSKTGELLGNTKEKLKIIDKSGIYKFNCNQCASFYIGQTINPLKKRMKQHISNYNNGYFEKSAVALHC